MAPKDKASSLTPPKSKSEKPLSGSELRKQKRDGDGSDDKNIKLPPGSVPHYDEGSRHIAALGYGLLVLLAAPVLSIDYLLPNNQLKFFQFSTVHMASLGILDRAPALEPVATAIMIPASFMQGVSLMVKYCMVDKDPVLCNIPSVFDPALILKGADVSDLMPIFKKHYSVSNLTLLYTGSIIVLFTAVAGMFRSSKPLRAGVLGFLLLVWATYTTRDAGILPTLLMEGFLGGYVLFFDPDGMKQDAERTARKKAKEKAKKDAASGITPVAAAGGSGSPAKSAAATPSSAKKTKSVDKKKLYDI